MLFVSFYSWSRKLPAGIMKVLSVVLVACAVAYCAGQQGPNGEFESLLRDLGAGSISVVSENTMLTDNPKLAGECLADNTDLPRPDCFMKLRKLQRVMRLFDDGATTSDVSYRATINLFHSIVKNLPGCADIKRNLKLNNLRCKNRN